MEWELPTPYFDDTMFKNIDKIKELKKENEELKKEIERLKAIEEIYKRLIVQCNNMKDEWRKAIVEARKSQANYKALCKELANNEMKKHN